MLCLHPNVLRNLISVPYRIFEKSQDPGIFQTICYDPKVFESISLGCDTPQDINEAANLQNTAKTPRLGVPKMALWMPKSKF